MIGLDTNILVRLLVEDDEIQTQQVADWLATSHVPGAPHFVSDLVLAETVWVLRAAYGFGRDEIAEALLTLFLNTVFAFEREDGEMFRLLQTYASTPVDLSDLLIRDRAHQRGCTHVISFDKRAIAAGVMQPLPTS